MKKFTQKIRIKKTIKIKQIKKYIHRHLFVKVTSNIIPLIILLMLMLLSNMLLPNEFLSLHLLQIIN